MKRKLISLLKIKAISRVLYLGFGLTCSSWLACSTIHKRQQLASVRQSANIQTSLQSQKLLELQEVDSNRQAFQMTIWPKSVFRINPDGSWESDAGRVEVWGESAERKQTSTKIGQQQKLIISANSKKSQKLNDATSAHTPVVWNYWNLCVLLMLVGIWLFYKSDVWKWLYSLVFRKAS